MARLIISSPGGKRGIYEISKSVITIGRGNSNDLVLDDASISRLHAVVKQVGADIVIADRGSTNGVLLNGERITADAKLTAGDRAHLGLFELRLEQVDDAKFLVQKAEIPSTVKDMIAQPMMEMTGAIVDTQEQLGRLERENYLLRVLYDAGKALNAKLSTEDIAAQVMSLAFRVEGVERGFLMFFDENGEVAHQSEVRYRTPPKDDQPQIILSKKIIQRIKDEVQPILIHDATADERFAESDSVRLSGLRSAICAPLASVDRLYALLYVDNLERASAFTQQELNVLSLVAAQAAAAIDNAMTHKQLSQQAIQRAALERFLSPAVVEMVAAHPDEVRLGGVSKEVSVLFADIRGFTGISEKMAPARVVEILNDYFTRVTDIIFGHDGTLDKYLGDGVMAVFGAPISRDNDARNAVRAAVEIQRLVVQLNRDAAARDWPELKIGIGINTGNVVAGNIGSPTRLDYTVIGDTVNAAARLMATARAGEVLISESTADKLPSKEFLLTSLEPLLLRGKTQKIGVYRVGWQQRAAAKTAK
jgi:adenylate cyclase